MSNFARIVDLLCDSSTSLTNEDVGHSAVIRGPSSVTFSTMPGIIVVTFVALLNVALDAISKLVTPVSVNSAGVSSLA